MICAQTQSLRQQRSFQTNSLRSSKALSGGGSPAGSMHSPEELFDLVAASSRSFSDKGLVISRLVFPSARLQPGGTVGRFRILLVDRVRWFASQIPAHLRRRILIQPPYHSTMAKPELGFTLRSPLCRDHALGDEMAAESRKRI